MAGPAPQDGYVLEAALREGARSLGIALSKEAIRQFERYALELLRWRRAANIAGFRTLDEVVARGFLESLAFLLVLPAEAVNVVDIGSGAGFPGLVLRIANPGLRVTLIEARRRRHSFLAHLCRLLGLGGVRCLLGRAEDLLVQEGLVGAFDAGLMRAVAGIEPAAKLAAGFLKTGGVLVTYQDGKPAGHPVPPAGYEALKAAAVEIEGRACGLLLSYAKTGRGRFT